MTYAPGFLVDFAIFFHHLPPNVLTARTKRDIAHKKVGEITLSVVQISSRAPSINIKLSAVISADCGMDAVTTEMKTEEDLVS